MAAIVNLVDDILCDIFSLTIQNTRVFPEIFKTGNDFRDCVSLINISRVCRRWREVALTDSSLWSSIYIHLDSPTARTLDKVTYFASICFTRSKDLSLICAISISNLDHLRFARPLVQTLISHEDRWSRIAINFTPSTRPFGSSKINIPESEDSDGEQDLLLRYAGSSHLKEFHSNLASWFTYSINSPLPALSTLRMTCFILVGCMDTLANLLPFALNLQELEVTLETTRFDADVVERNMQVWMAAVQEAKVRPHFTLPALQTLNIHAPLIPLFTCSALKIYVMQTISWRPSDLTNYLEFIERSGLPPSFRTIEVRSTTSLWFNAPVRGYFLPTITNLLITSPEKRFFTMFYERSREDGVVGFSVLPALKYLEITDCGDGHLPFFSSLITSRWDIGAPHRTLKSVRLNRCFTSSPVPELLLSPPSNGIDLTRVEENWREIARCVNEGLSLFAC
ncbi:hypothetical protein SCHPADRAFT_911355 [Schizopora paradoxa]|uniref:F-box domain-containing protein n=1 Tax=Schizopora paradoxa TaxID=27342 RepID=A0A0H2QZW6_9AGAM|nr:hypothetical protein SCHPADRAFT_911355 [Schizopora paradoxa]